MGRPEEISCVAGDRKSCLNFRSLLTEHKALCIDCMSGRTRLSASHGFGNVCLLAKDSDSLAETLI